MENIINFLIITILFTSFYTFIFFKNNKKNKGNELKYFVKKYNLDKKKLNIKRMLITIAFINGTIIGFVSTLLFQIDFQSSLQIGFGFIVAFFLLFALIYATYEIYGRLLQKKAGKK